MNFLFCKDLVYTTTNCLSCFHQEENWTLAGVAEEDVSSNPLIQEHL